MLRSSLITEAKKSSDSFCIASRRGSSKAGNMVESGLTADRLRSWSHWPAKFSTSPWALGSLSIRDTCLVSVSGVCSVFSAASLISSSSGMVLHRKYERREAISKSLSGTEPGGRASLARRGACRD